MMNVYHREIKQLESQGTRSPRIRRLIQYNECLYPQITLMQQTRIQGWVFCERVATIEAEGA